MRKTTDIRESFIRDVSLDKEEAIKFWKSSAPGSGSRNFLKDSSSTLQRRAFFSHTLAHISGITVHENFTRDVPSHKKVFITFWK